MTKAQYKGYLKILQACIVGLEHCYNTPGSNGLASMFHVLEIAHSHFWAENDATTPGSGISSVVIRIIEYYKLFNLYYRAVLHQLQYKI